MFVGLFATDEYDQAVGRGEVKQEAIHTWDSSKMASTGQ